MTFKSNNQLINIMTLKSKYSNQSTKKETKSLKFKKFRKRVKKRDHSGFFYKGDGTYVVKNSKEFLGYLIGITDGIVPAGETKISEFYNPAIFARVKVIHFSSIGFFVSVATDNVDPWLNYLLFFSPFTFGFLDPLSNRDMYRENASPVMTRFGGGQ